MEKQEKLLFEGDKRLNSSSHSETFLTEPKTKKNVKLLVNFSNLIY